MRSDKRNKRIIFLVPYPVGYAPGQRFRFEQYLPILCKLGYELEIEAFLDSDTNRILYKRGLLIKKAFGVLRGAIKRVSSLYRISKYDYVFIFREAAPIGPPVIEWIIAKILRKRIIYDFDDAIWLPNTSEENKWIAKLKWHSKVASICKWSYKMSCGNQYLCTYAQQYNKNIVLNPTTIDTVQLHNPELYPPRGNEKKLVIGWTGSHSTLIYLNLILPALQELEKKYTFTFLVIADRKPDISLNNLQFRPWNKETEIQDLMQLDIGLMPLTNDRWSKGKCGFKALQYMALGIPALGSPVGVNKQIIENDVNGYLCNTPQEWYNNIETLILHPELRKSFGEKGRKKVVNHYSVLANTHNFLGLFQ